MFDRLEALKAAGWDCLMENYGDDGWTVELTIGSECLCVVKPCEHGRFVQASGETLLAALDTAVHGAELVKWRPAKNVA